MNEFNKIMVVGLGYIGLPTAAMFASRKISVVGLDVNARAVETINSGKIHIVEPDLDIVVSAVVKEKYLQATLTPEPADAFLIAVPTPFHADTMEPDLSFIEAACRTIAPVLARGNLVVLESTSPVGTTEKIAGWLAAARPDLAFPAGDGGEADIDVAYCPERVLPGKVMRELIANDRIVGGLTPRSSQRAVALYKTFVQGDCLVTNARTAEMAKLTENSFRDVNIAFANELSLICDHLGINVWELIHLANRHPRVNILQPGPGVGGHCIAVDPWFIVASAPEQSRLIRTAREVNDGKPEFILEKISSAIQSVVEKMPTATTSEISVACYGLAFKANIDDLRESPAVKIADMLLQKHHGPVLFVEPNIRVLPKQLEAGTLVELEAAVNKAKIHVMLVDHDEFRNIKPPIGTIVDARGVWR